MHSSRMRTSAAVAISGEGGVCPGGVCVPTGVCAQGGVCPGGATSRGCLLPPTHVNRITDVCENITLPLWVIVSTNIGKVSFEGNVLKLLWKKI